MSKNYSISIQKKESGCPIFQTDVNPIDYSTYTDKIGVENIEGVEGAFLVHHVLNENECKQYIAISEEMGYGEALLSVDTQGTMIKMDNVRNNKRVFWQTTQDIWGPIWERIKEVMPQDIMIGRSNWNTYSLNERFRFYRYVEGEVFRPHFDGSYPRNYDEESFLTIIIYLSDDFEGGYTTFFPRGRRLTVKPITGTALLFFHGDHPHSPLHEGSGCSNGVKYVLRSDIMYIRN